MKIDLSYSVKRWLKDSLIIILILQIFYLLTKCGFFIFFIFGYIFGCVVNAISQYILEVRKQNAIRDFESAIAKNYENEVTENE